MRFGLVLMLGTGLGAMGGAVHATWTKGEPLQDAVMSRLPRAIMIGLGA
ncbi:hypothetical protein LP419_23315 [Massilia sp. H-1]|nr:hypothetical protein LP419_23315 [Massilia sp. H-1]